MANFTYTAIDNNGAQIKGTIDCSDEKGAISQLASQSIFVTDINKSSSSKAALSASDTASSLTGSTGISNKDVLAMTTQLGTGLKSGLPLLNCLEIIRDGQHKKSMHSMLNNLCDSVRSGKSLSQAMESQGKIFSPLYVSMVRVGETGGILDQTVEQLANLLAREEKVKSSMKTAATYPALVLAIGLISAFVIIRFILPKMLDSITGGEAMLPWPTRAMLSLSDFFSSYGWFIFVIIIATILLFIKWKSTHSGRRIWDGIKLNIPVLGPVLVSIAVGRFTRTLGSLSRCGITILDALKVVRDTLGNEVLAMEIDKVTESVCAGQPLAQPLEESDKFPPLLVQIVSIGEQTGKLDELLLNAAETFDVEADTAINRFMAIFPAALILLLALVIAFVIAAALLPIIAMDLSGAI